MSEQRVSDEQAATNARLERERAEAAEAQAARLRAALCGLMNIDGSRESLDQMRVGIALAAGSAPDPGAPEAAMRCVDALAEPAADALAAIKRQGVEEARGGPFADVALVRISRFLFEELGARDAEGWRLTYKATDLPDGTTELAITRTDDGWLAAIKREVAERVREACEHEASNTKAAQAHLDGSGVNGGLVEAAAKMASELTARDVADRIKRIDLDALLAAREVERG